jgi:hypothetical protein
MAAEQSTEQLTSREKYLERQRRYNASEKGLARHKPGGGRHHRRRREIAVLDGKLEAILREHPDLAWIVERQP